VEQAATVAAQDNMELACAFIQKTAIEKAIPEIDKRLLTVSLLYLSLVPCNQPLKGELDLLNCSESSSYFND
jgi:hypothetical protein